MSTLPGARTGTTNPRRGTGRRVERSRSVPVGVARYDHYLRAITGYLADGGETA
jgi:hypothetical protein